MLYRAGQGWIVDFFVRRGWLVKQRRPQLRRGLRRKPVLALAAEICETRLLLSTVTFTAVTTIGETNTTYEGDDIVIKGTTVAIDGPHSFNSIQVISSGVLTHDANTATQTHKLDLTVTQQVVVDATSRIDVTGKGYLGGRTTGNTTVGASTDVAGGSYGGLGGIKDGRGVPNHVYGDYADPEDWGSGGPSSIDGSGGGLVQVHAGTLQLDGQLLADGGDSLTAGNSSGSGGGILIQVDTLAGTGLIRAAGGDTSNYSGGGGGRIAVYTPDLSGFTPSQITAPGGINIHGGAGASGGAGTVYLRDPHQSMGTLIVDAGNGGNGITPLGLSGQTDVSIADVVDIRGSRTQVRAEHAGLALTFLAPLTVEDNAKFFADALTTQAQFTLTGGAAASASALTNQARFTLTGGATASVATTFNVQAPLSLTAGALLEVRGTTISALDFTVDAATFSGQRVVVPNLSAIDGAVITAPAATATQVYKLDLEVAGTILVDATSRIDVTGKGYLGGRTTGNTTVGASTDVAGGSYGGLGGIKDGRGVPNHVYGDYADPEDWGSGGPSSIDGSGGGLVQVHAGTLQLDGQLLADGGDSLTAGNSSGSGGGILIQVDTLAGTGLIRAAGGDTSNYSGGGGGRIAVYTPDLSGFTPSQITAPGGINIHGGAGASGGAGTVYLRDPHQSMGTLIVDAGNGGNGITPLGLSGQTDVSIADVVDIRGSRTQVRAEHAGLALTFLAPLTVEDNAKFFADALTTQAQFTLTGGAAASASALTNQARFTLTGGATASVATTFNVQAPLSLTAGALLEVRGTTISALDFTVDAATFSGQRVVVPNLSAIDGAVITAPAATASPSGASHREGLFYWQELVD